MLQEPLWNETEHRSATLHTLDEVAVSILQRVVRLHNEVADVRTLWSHLDPQTNMPSPQHVFRDSTTSCCFAQFQFYITYWNTLIEKDVWVVGSKLRNASFERRGRSTFQQLGVSAHHRVCVSLW